MPVQMFLGRADTKGTLDAMDKNRKELVGKTDISKDVLLRIGWNL